MHLMPIALSVGSNFTRWRRKIVISSQDALFLGYTLFRDTGTLLLSPFRSLRYCGCAEHSLSRFESCLKDAISGPLVFEIWRPPGCPCGYFELFRYNYDIVIHMYSIHAVPVLEIHYDNY